MNSRSSIAAVVLTQFHSSQRTKPGTGKLMYL